MPKGVAKSISLSHVKLVRDSAGAAFIIGQPKVGTGLRAVILNPTTYDHAKASEVAEAVDGKSIVVALDEVGYVTTIALAL
jgi:hypothetical protein